MAIIGRFSLYKTEGVVFVCKIPLLARRIRPKGQARARR